MEYAERFDPNLRQYVRTRGEQLSDLQEPPAVGNADLGEALCVLRMKPLEHGRCTLSAHKRRPGQMQSVARGDFGERPTDITTAIGIGGDPIITRTFFSSPTARTKKEKVHWLICEPHWIQPTGFPTIHFGVLTSMSTGCFFRTTGPRFVTGSRERWQPPVARIRPGLRSPHYLDTQRPPRRCGDVTSVANH